MATLTKTRLTAEEFERRFADRDFCELERGEVVPLTAGGWRHSSISFRAALLVGKWAEQAGTGRVLTNEAGLITSRDPDTVRGVDVMYFSYERVPRGREPESFAEVAPSLAVEIIGKGQGWKKMTEKAGEYLRMGADRVWIIDPRDRSLHVFQADQPPRRYGDTETLSDDPIMQGFSCRVADLFDH